MYITIFALFPTVTSTAGTTGCAGQAPYPCLPGLDAIGVGYDAVQGSSFGVGRPVIQMNFTKGAGKVWTDPFGNKTAFSYADQASVMQKTDQITQHSIYRSVNEYISQQQTNAHADAEYGMFFKASVDTQWAKTTMSDSLHIVAESSCELGVYTITLDPPMFLKLDPIFEQIVNSLPTQYDANAYSQLIRFYGTHYVSSGTLGGRARMRTVISHDYYSTQSDSSISAQLHIAWGLFGGGGGGGSSSKTHDQNWDSSATSYTHTEGGDPAISSFNSQSEWTAWAQSVETTSPVLTSVTLEPLWSLIPVSDPRRDNIMKAVAAYAKNETFPAPDLANYMMSWCDCEAVTHGAGQIFPVSPHRVSGNCDGSSGGEIIAACPTGKVVTAYAADACGGSGTITNKEGGLEIACCRPCFTAQN